MNYPLSIKNPLINFAKIEGKKPHWAVALLLTFGFLILGQILGMGIYLLIKSPIKALPLVWKSTLSLESQLILGNLPVILMIFLWMHFYEKRPFSHLGFQKNNAFNLYLKGLFGGILMFGSVVGILALLHFVTWEKGNPLMQGINLATPTFIILIGFLIQGATEEILCRGWLMPILSARYNLWVGILVSSSLFGLIHGLNPGVTVFAIVNIVLVGIFFSLFALRQGSLWGACGLHSIWNWMQGNLFGFQVSGQDGGPTLLNIKEIGPDWITGGTFGPEGGFICTFIILVGIAIILFLNNSDRKKIQSQQL